MTEITFNKKKIGFFDEIKEKVDQYFVENKLSRYGNNKIYFKSIVFGVVAILSYLTILFAPVSLGILMSLYAVMGVLFAGIGFNIMHDGGHGSYSKKNWLNELVGYSLNLMGGNIFIWKNKHNYNHHMYTNIKGMDDDIDIEPWIRTHVDQPKRWFHRYQHIYALGLYGLTYFNWVFIGDFKKYFSKKIGNTSLHPMDFKEHSIFWLSKVLSCVLLLVIPMMTIGFWKALFGYMVLSFICGLILGVVFQLAHLIEEVEFPVPAHNSHQMEKNWVLHQIATTANFATHNQWIFWFTGGLNFQVVHHIFPKINHIHYPEINQLIRSACRKHEIKYTEYPSFWSALRSHLFFLKRIGA